MLIERRNEDMFASAEVFNYSIYIDLTLYIYIYI